MIFGYNINLLFRLRTFISFYLQRTILTQGPTYNREKTVISRVKRLKKRFDRQQVRERAQRTLEQYQNVFKVEPLLTVKRFSEGTSLGRSLKRYKEDIFLNEVLITQLQQLAKRPSDHCVSKSFINQKLRDLKDINKHKEVLEAQEIPSNH